MGALLLATAGLVTACWILRRPTPDPDRLWVEAETQFLAGHWSVAERELGRLDRLRPRTAKEWVLAAQIASARGRTDEALRDLDGVPDSDPLAPKALLMAGRLERARHRLRAAEAAFRRAIALDRNLVDAHKELIYILGLQLRRHEADAEFHELERLTPLNHHDLFTWALTHFTTWSPDVAADLEAALTADPTDRASRMALAEVLEEQPGAGARLEEVLSVLPCSDPNVLAMRVRQALKLGRWDEAEDMLARNPATNPALDRLRGRLALRRGDAQAAIACFRRALGSDPFDRVSTFDLAQALTLHGENEEAQPLMDRVRRLNDLYNLVVRIRSPEHESQAPDLLELGRACEAAGLLDEARGWFGLAISRNPLDTEAQAALYRLASQKGAAGSPRRP